jgi:glucose-1-phosphate cytidylyltransferase
VACGYRADIIKRYFNELYFLNADFTIDLGTGQREILDPRRFDWLVSCIDTGRSAMT